MVDEENMCFSIALRQLRQAHGWSRDELAGRIGVDVRSVEHWEYGECLPYPCHINLLARYKPEIKQIYMIVKKRLIRCISLFGKAQAEVFIVL